jgi:hypothetical protein
MRKKRTKKQTSSAFAERVVLLLSNEASDLMDRATRIKAQVRLIARLHGIDLPPLED